MLKRANAADSTKQGDEKVRKTMNLIDQDKTFQNIYEAGGLRQLMAPLAQFRPFAPPPPEDAVVCVAIPNPPYQHSLVVGRYTPNGLLNMLAPTDFIIVEHFGQQATTGTLGAHQYFPIDSSAFNSD